MKGRFPVAALFINVPFEHVDVNVHPAKQEVKFVRQKQVHKSVQQAVLDTLGRSENRKWKSSPEKHRWRPSDNYGSTVRVNKDISASEPAASYRRQGVLPHAYREQPKTDYGSDDKKICFADLKIIGQIHDTYIACESDQGLVLIDQHAAHERIVFERLKARYDGSKGPGQRLLIPETFELSFSESEILEKLIPELCRFGLEIELFGNNTFAVSSVPAILGEKEIKPVIVEIVEKIAETGFGPDIQKAVDKSLILMACHGAIRANQSLTETEIKALFDQLDQCEKPSHCPHGRPTWIKWTRLEIEKMFGRRAG
jgi:DNA mismatch repair protein MutL